MLAVPFSAVDFERLTGEKKPKAKKGGTRDSRNIYYSKGNIHSPKQFYHNI